MSQDSLDLCNATLVQRPWQDYSTKHKPQTSLWATPRDPQWIGGTAVQSSGVTVGFRTGLGAPSRLVSRTISIGFVANDLSLSHVDLENVYRKQCEL